MTHLPQSPDPGSRLALLHALWDAITNGDMGTPQERLAVKAARITIDNRLNRLVKLPIMEQGRVWLAAASGEDVEPLLPPDPSDDPSSK
jgi:hypothetical protein